MREQLLLAHNQIPLVGMKHWWGLLYPCETNESKTPPALQLHELPVLLTMDW